MCAIKPLVTARVMFPTVCVFFQLSRSTVYDSSHFPICLFSSRKGEVLGSRKDFQMNLVSIHASSGSVTLDARSQSLITLQPVQQRQQQQAGNADS